MGNVESLGHTRWGCKYHLVWVPKFRRKVLYGQLRKYIGQVLHDLTGQKESKILEGHLQADHVHMLVSNPPKYSVSQVVGFIKGKSAIHLRGAIWDDARTTPGCTSGPVAISFQRSVPMRRRSVRTYRTKRKRTLDSINWGCYRRIDRR
jgi:REP element-mobilizing transposase RayT